MNFLKKSEKRVRFQDDITVTGAIRKKSRKSPDKNPEDFENFKYPEESEWEDYHKSYFEAQRLRSCYTPERVKRVCPDFEPSLDFSIGWAKKFLRKISM